MNKSILYLVLSLSVSRMVFGEDCGPAEPRGDVQAQIEAAVKQIEEGGYGIAEGTATWKADAIPILARYTEHPSRDVRAFALKVVAVLGVRAEEPIYRKQAVQLLVESLTKEPALPVCDDVLRFKSKDFTTETKGTIRSLLGKEHGSHHFLYRLVLICGRAAISEEVGRLQELKLRTPDELYSKPWGRWGGGVGWAARLALARMGDDKELRFCVKVVENAPEFDVVLRLLPELAYVSRPPALEIILKYLESEDRLPPVKETVEGSMYAVYALRALAHAVEGCPVKYGESVGYQREDLVRAREWTRSEAKFVFVDPAVDPEDETSADAPGYSDSENAQLGGSDSPGTARAHVGRVGDYRINAGSGSEGIVEAPDDRMSANRRSVNTQAARTETCAGNSQEQGHGVLSLRRIVVIVLLLAVGFAGGMLRHRYRKT